MRRRQKKDFTRYQMREKLVSIGNDFWIEDENGDRIFKVDGKAMRVRDTLVIEDRQGNPLCKTQERKLRVKDTMEIESPDGMAWRSPRVRMMPSSLLSLLPWIL